MKWEASRRLEPKGHRIFRRASDGRWAIADNSGPTPDRTEDGILWLDFSRPLRVQIGEYKGADVPVLVDRDDNAQSRTMTGVRGFAALRLAFPEWKVVITGDTEDLLIALDGAVVEDGRFVVRYVAGDSNTRVDIDTDEVQRLRTELAEAKREAKRYLDTIGQAIAVLQEPEENEEPQLPPVAAGGRS